MTGRRGWSALGEGLRSSAGRVHELLPGRADFASVRRSPRSDLLAGLTVAVVALPLALAFGVASGMGAAAGLMTAIVAGVVAAVFGGSNLQVSGPTGAMTVVLVPVAHQFGPTGVLMVGLMAGVLLLLMAFARLGGFVRHLPIPLVEGFTAGIAVVIALQQVPYALGVAPAEAERVWRVAADAVHDFAAGFGPGMLAAPLIAVVVCLVMLVGGRLRPGIPYALIAVAVATAVVALAGVDVPTIGVLPSLVPTPSLAFVDLDAVGPLLTSALAVAALAALESLLCATVADSMTVGERHDPDRELFGQGMANVVTPLFGGVPATAAIARTAVNVRAGASSRLAAVFHAVVLLVIALAAAPLVEDVPLAALAGVLFATTIRMVEVPSLVAMARSSTGDAFVLLTTFAITVAIDLVVAVVVGLVVAVAIALRDVASSARLETVPLDLVDHAEEEHELLRQHIVALRFDGPLVFAAAHQLLSELPELADVKVVILRMSRVTGLDATGALLLRDAVGHLEKRGVTVLVSGVRPDHDPILDTLGVITDLRARQRVFSTTPAAIAAARLLLAQPGFS